MAVVLLKLVFLAFSTLSNLISRVIFSATAYLLVLLIQVLKVPGEAMHVGLEKVSEGIKECLKYFLEKVILEMAVSLGSAGLEMVTKGFVESGGFTSAVVTGLMEKMKLWAEKIMEDVPGVLEGVKEVISTVVADLWKNYVEAVAYVKENA